MQAFVREHPDVPVFLVDVLGSRPLSQALAARLGVRHESPQVILLHAGIAAWHASHSAVTADAIRENRRT